MVECDTFEKKIGQASLGKVCRVNCKELLEEY